MGRVLSTIIASGLLITGALASGEEQIGNNKQRVIEKVEQIFLPGNPTIPQKINSILSGICKEGDCPVKEIIFEDCCKGQLIIRIQSSNRGSITFFPQMKEEDKKRYPLPLSLPFTPVLF